MKHNIGDTVKVTDSGSFFFGKVGVVSHFDEELFWNVFVQFQDNTTCNFRHKELEAQ